MRCAICRPMRMQAHAWMAAHLCRDLPALSAFLSLTLHLVRVTALRALTRRAGRRAVRPRGDRRCALPRHHEGAAGLGLLCSVWRVLQRCLIALNLGLQLDYALPSSGHATPACVHARCPGAALAAGSWCDASDGEMNGACYQGVLLCAARMLYMRAWLQV